MGLSYSCFSAMLNVKVVNSQCRIKRVGTLCLCNGHLLLVENAVMTRNKLDGFSLPVYFRVAMLFKYKV